MQRALFTLFSFVLLIPMLSSCMKDNSAELKAKEDRLLKDYISRNNITVQPTASGLYYISQQEGTGLSPVAGDFVLIHFYLKDLEGRVLDTDDKQYAETAKIVNSSVIDGPMKIRVGELNVRGLNEGLPMMKEGGKSRLIMPSSIAFGDYNPVIFEIELVEVIPDPFVYDRVMIARYLDTIPGISPADSLASGIYFIERVVGTGDKVIEDNSLVSVRYKGTLLDGRVFDQNLTASAPSTFKPSGVIPGFANALKNMKKGGKAKVVIPYYLAYGANGTYAYYGQLARVVVPPYSGLVFEIEVIDVQ